jgi:hypothetical protein
MSKKKIPIWMDKIISELMQVIPNYKKDLGGPLSVLKYGKGSDYGLLGTIYKLIGEPEKAKEAFMEASLAYWPYESGKPEGGWQGDANKPEYIYEERAGERQRAAAICAFLAGDRERSDKIFGWAGENLNIPKYALDFNRPGGQGEHLCSGELILCQAYVEARLGRYSAAKEKITEANSIFDYFVREKNKTIDMDYKYQCKVLMELLEYKLNPTEENKAIAQNALLSYKNACQENMGGLMNYLYIFDFQEAFPEVFDPVLQ